MEEKRGPQQGQSIVIVAVAMLALVVFVAVSIDMSSAYVGRRTAQNAADGAAGAGARRLAFQINYGPFSDEWIKRDMNDLAERNGVSDTGGALADATNDNVEGWYLDEEQNRIGLVGAGTVPADTWGIEAVTYITTSAFFGGMLGFDAYPLQAEAAVMLEQACGEDCLVPIATHLRPFTMTEGLCYEIWNGIDPGNFGWVNWDNQPPPANHCGVNTPCLIDNFDTPCNSGFIQVGDWVSATTGVASALGNQKDHGLMPYLTEGNTVTVIVWDTTRGAGGTNVAYRVAGFARLQLIAYQLSATSKPDVADWWPIKYKDDPTLGCLPAGTGEPEDKNMIWAQFLGYTGGVSGGSCRAVGTLRAPVFVK
jgi:hypothetical protein